MPKKTSKKISKKEKITLTVSRAPLYQKYYVTNVMGGRTAHDFRFELFNEKIQSPEGDWCMIADASIILSPIGAKRMFLRLKEALDDFEAEFGPIPKDPKDDKMIQLRL